MNIWLKLRKTAAITLCELLAIATIFTGCASADLSGTEGAGHAAELKWQVRIFQVL